MSYRLCHAYITMQFRYKFLNCDCENLGCIQVIFWLMWAIVDHCMDGSSVRFIKMCGVAIFVTNTYEESRFNK